MVCGKRTRIYLDAYTACEVNACVFSFEWGNLTHAHATRSIQLFVEELMPRYAYAQPREDIRP